MNKAWRILAAALLIIFAAESPLLAAEATFKHCSASDPVLSKGAAIIRTRAPDGQQIFQSSMPLPITRDGDKRLRAYLVWPERGSEDVPKLWILHESYAHEGIVSGQSELRMQAAGAKKASPTAIGQQLSRGDFEIFEIELAALESQFAGVEMLKMRIVDVSERPRLASHWEPKEVLNLSALRAEIAAYRAAAQSTNCAATQIVVRQEVDANAYTICMQSSRGDFGSVSVDAWRFQWQYPLAPFGYLNADRTIYVGEGDDAFLAAIDKPFHAPHGPLVFRTGENGKAVAKTLVMTADTVRFEASIKQTEANIDPDAAMRLDATGLPIRLVTLDQQGKVLSEGELPAKLFSRVRAELLAVREKLTAAQKNPMKNCAPEHSIIVT